jgi:hypothetical protein
VRLGERRTLGGLELLGLGGAADTSGEATEGNTLIVLGDVAEVGVRLRELEAWNIAIRSPMIYQICASNAPLTAAATSRMFLKCVRRYSPRARAAADDPHRQIKGPAPNVQHRLFSGW